MGGAARSTQPASLAALYCQLLQHNNKAAPFFFYYNPHRYPAFLSGIHQVLEQQTPRNDVFVASGGTDRSPTALNQRLMDALQHCGGEYLDLFVVEYVCPEELTTTKSVVSDSDDNTPLHERLQAGPQLNQALAHLQGLVQTGQIRHVAISTHSHLVGAVLARHEAVEALLLRYGPSHCQAAEQLSLPAARHYRKPAVAFTTTRWNALLAAKDNDDTSGPAPTASDCLSFALSAGAEVEVVLHSARDEQELHHAVQNLRINLNDDQIQTLREYGRTWETSDLDGYDEYPEEQFLTF